MAFTKANDANCVSGRYNFNSNRVAITPTNPVDPNEFDFTVDYGTPNVKFDSSSSGVYLALVQGQNGQPDTGARLSTTRFIQYARMTVAFKAVPKTGVVTTFITMSEEKDEIDWEILGSQPNSAATNVFYKGIKEFDIHSTTENLNDVSKLHTYEIDWRSDLIRWGIDGDYKRTLIRNQSVSPMTPKGEFWFPNTPSQIQISIWTTEDSPDVGVRNWGGGKVPWGSAKSFSAYYEYVDIQCYNNKNQPVARWPADAQQTSTTSDVTTITGSSLYASATSLSESQHYYTTSPNASITVTSNSAIATQTSLSKTFYTASYKTISTKSLAQTSTASLPTNIGSISNAFTNSPSNILALFALLFFII